MPCFESLFIFLKDFYLSDNMLDIYRESNLLKQDFNDEKIRIDLMCFYTSLHAIKHKSSPL